MKPLYNLLRLSSDFFKCVQKKNKKNKKQNKTKEEEEKKGKKEKKKNPTLLMRIYAHPVSIRILIFRSRVNILSNILGLQRMTFLFYWQWSTVSINAWYDSHNFL